MAVQPSNALLKVLSVFLCSSDGWVYRFVVGIDCLDDRFSKFAEHREKGHDVLSQPRIHRPDVIGCGGTQVHCADDAALIGQW